MTWRWSSARPLRPTTFLVELSSPEKSTPRRNPMKVAGPVVGKLHLHEQGRNAPRYEEKIHTILMVPSDYFFDEGITLKSPLKDQEPSVFLFPVFKNLYTSFQTKNTKTQNNNLVLHLSHSSNNQKELIINHK